jgi:L-2,4-diaminobutyric acid acetyltransferase
MTAPPSKGTLRTFTDLVLLPTALAARAPGAAPWRLRGPEPGDAPALWALAGACGLDRNSHYAYALLGRYFVDSCRVTEDAEANVIGFVSGFRVPADPGVLFVWQVAVAPHQRGRGIAGRMLDDLADRLDIHTLEASVTPRNTASMTLFRAFGTRRGGMAVETPLFGPELLGPGHEPEILVRIALHDGAVRTATDRR